MDLNMKEYLLLSFVVLIYSFASTEAAYPSQCCKDPHEKYVHCGPACGGDGCSPRVYAKACNQSCAAGCFCECGYFRNSDGKCVTANECPNGVSNVEYPKLCPGHQCCGRYENYYESNNCFNQCPPKDYNLIIDCIRTRTFDCYCLPGYYKNPDTLECVPVLDCPCKGHFEKRLSCASVCQSCDYAVAAYQGKPKPCQKNCLVNACQCNEGYYRNQNNLCITKQQCLIDAGII